MRFNRFLHLIAFAGKAHRGSPASGGLTTKMPDGGAPSQAMSQPDFSPYLPLSAEGYPADSDLPAGTGGRQVLLAGTDWGNNNVTRPELHHVLGDNWDSNPDEDWIGVDLQQGEEYTVRLRTKTSLPERLQATQLKILGIKDADGNAISGTASAGDAGKKVFVTNWEAPSTGRHYIAVGTEGTDRTGIYWISITRKVSN